MNIPVQISKTQKFATPICTALIAGGGIGGLSAALALGRAGCEVKLFEKAAAFSEVGAGIQLGPNVTRLLHGWGLEAALAHVAAFPAELRVRSAQKGGELGALSLGKTALHRYGAPYATVHRADLLALVLGAVQRQTGAQLQLDCALNTFSQSVDGVSVASVSANSGAPADVSGDLLVAADGLWSPIRQWLLNDGSPRATGHLAYRALVEQSKLPQGLRSPHVTVWLGTKLHVVQYPVRGGDWLNVVVIIEAPAGAPFDVESTSWDQAAPVTGLQAALSDTCTALQDLVNAIPEWRLWALHDRPPMAGAHEHGRDRVVLLGDAAHPMRPYLAQGAGMAIEDAAVLAGQLSGLPAADIPASVARFADSRWRRNARVQGRAIRNGQIFHASGSIRVARDLAMQLLGERLLDLPWLYRGI